MVAQSVECTLDSIVEQNLLTDRTKNNTWYISINMRNPKIYCVYKIHRPHSNDLRYYIGVTNTGGNCSIANRFNAHKKSDYAVGCFIRKYEDALIEVIVNNLTQVEAYTLEKLLVPSADVQRKSLNLLNETEGGNIPPHFKQLSPEKQKQLREKRSINAKRLNADPEYAANKISKMKKADKIRDPNGNIHFFKGIRDFAKANQLDHTCLGRVLSGEYKSVKGWTKVIDEQ